MAASAPEWPAGSFVNNGLKTQNTMDRRNSSVVLISPTEFYHIFFLSQKPTLTH